MTALHFRSAADLVRLLEQREISAVALLAPVIARDESLLGGFRALPGY
jgi:hypothetical protein